MSRVVVLGLGYIGLPTAATLALHGWEVHGVDVRAELVESLKQGNVPVRERDLSAIVRDALGGGDLQVSTKPENGDYFVLCVPTPLKDRQADLSYLRKASATVAGVLRRGNTVIVESTVPPGTTTQIVRPILEKSGLEAGKDFHLAYCPERVMPGSILREIVENDRIIGGFDPESAEEAASIYRSFVRGKLFLTDATTAEFVKLVENAYRDVNVAFANEIAKLAEVHGVDVWEVISLANHHPRVRVLQPGPGVGGHCIAVDPWFLLTQDVKGSLIPAARAVNDGQPKQVVQRTLEIVHGISRPKVAAFGVAYKGEADDIRESPAIEIIERLEGHGITVAAYDPLVPNDRYPTQSLEETIGDADCILILASHREFHYMDASPLSKRVRHRFLFDTKNCVDHRKWTRAGFTVHVLGRAAPIAPPG